MFKYKKVRKTSSKKSNFWNQEIKLNTFLKVLGGVTLVLIFVGLPIWYVYSAISSVTQTMTVPTPYILLSTISPTGTNFLSPTITPTPSITISNQLSANADENGSIENWNTYTNESYNYSFKYPSGWQVSDTRGDYFAFPGFAYGDNYAAYTNKIESPNKLFIKFTTGVSGVGGRCNDDPNITLGNDRVTFFNIPMHLIFNGDKQKNQVNAAYLLTDSYTCPNIAFFDISYVGTIQSGIHYGLESLFIAYESQTLKNLTDFQSHDYFVAKKILSTFRTATEKIKK